MLLDYACPFICMNYILLRSLELSVKSDGFVTIFESCRSMFFFPYLFLFYSKFFAILSFLAHIASAWKKNSSFWLVFIVNKIRHCKYLTWKLRVVVFFYRSRRFSDYRRTLFPVLASFVINFSCETKLLILNVGNSECSILFVFDSLSCLIRFVCI